MCDEVSGGSLMQIDQHEVRPVAFAEVAAIRAWESVGDLTHMVFCGADVSTGLRLREER
jgi:hypothetical protein